MRVLGLVSLALLAGCATPGGDAAPATGPRLLLGPIRCVDVPEPAHSRRDSVRDELARYLGRRGFRVERVASDDPGALRSGPDADGGAYAALIVPRVVTRWIEAKRRTFWDGVYLSPPTRNIPKQFQREYQGGQRIRVLSLEVEIRSPEGAVIYEGAGGLDHLEQFNYSRRTGVRRDEYAKTLQKRDRIRNGIAAALDPWLDQRRAGAGG